MMGMMVGDVGSIGVLGLILIGALGVGWALHSGCGTVDFARPHLSLQIPSKP